MRKSRKQQQRLLRNMSAHAVVLELLQIPYEKVGGPGRRAGPGGSWAGPGWAWPVWARPGRRAGGAGREVGGPRGLGPRRWAGPGSYADDGDPKAGFGTRLKQTEHRKRKLGSPVASLRCEVLCRRAGTFVLPTPRGMGTAGSA